MKRLINLATAREAIGAMPRVVTVEPGTVTWADPESTTSWSTAPDAPTPTIEYDVISHSPMARDRMHLNRHERRAARAQRRAQR